ncbi:glycosyltransferase family 4 protein [Sporocytophaga myxococcoides]|uniref:glycosyltransferase family 4 protein n=1 Tax=Sporocytophaga myxococcoides TaxID=153721 RepID=UPI00048A6894|nr:glycosyltransferase family 1 protein [Sporocytophaga myxococcoides]
MSRLLRFVLIGNYKLDKQESMARYANSLQIGLSEAGIHAEIWYPVVFFARWSKSTITGLGKWLGYLDKWILFPLVLKFRILIFRIKHSDENIFFHVCDHSNAPYLAHLPLNRSGITCHDVLAIRGALGFKDAYCPASPAGKVLQKWILANLIKAKRLTAVSQFTLNQLYELASGERNNQNGKKWRVIHNFYNASFEPMDVEKRRKMLLNILPDTEFILHVGSSLPRKNRPLLIGMLKNIGDKWDGKVCFAGEKLDEELKNIIDGSGLKDRFFSVEKPEHDTLVALYSSCLAFIFPSFSEGFGWPLIEAQACGAPVIASKIESLNEVSGGSALHADPEKPAEFANAFLQVLEKSFRDQLIRKGFDNCARFEKSRLIGEFIQLYTDR